MEIICDILLMKEGLNTMENKKNNTIIIILLTVLIMIALFGITLVVLNSKGIISLTSNNTSSTDVDEINGNSDNHVEEEKDEAVVNKSINFEMAVEIATAAANKVGLISNGYPYCGDNMTYDEKDVILDEHGLSSHTASKDYKSLNEMKADLKKYMSDDIINKYIKDNYYIEKDSKLYCETPHKGGIFYDTVNSSYNITSFDENEIVAYGIMARHSEGDTYRNDVNIQLKNNGSNYIITKYEVKSDYIFDTNRY